MVRQHQTGNLEILGSLANGSRPGMTVRIPALVHHSATVGMQQPARNIPGEPLVPTFRSSCSVASHPPSRTSKKSWALAGLFNLVPPYRSEVPESGRGSWCWDFRSAVLVPNFRSSCSVASHPPSRTSKKSWAANGVDLTFATRLTAYWQSECQILNSTRFL